DKSSFMNEAGGDFSIQEWKSVFDSNGYSSKPDPVFVRDFLVKAHFDNPTVQARIILACCNAPPYKPGPESIVAMIKATRWTPQLINEIKRQDPEGKTFSRIFEASESGDALLEIMGTWRGEPTSGSEEKQAIDYLLHIIQNPARASL